MLFAAVALVQDKRFFTTAPKDIQAAVLKHNERDKKRKGVHGTDIAGELKVSRPTVSVALKALAEEGYIFVDDACEMEHAVSQASYEALKMLVEKQMEKV
ncbi:MAG: ArsR family transcriptional regulator [Eubacterium sp.]|nr:ArsR family transcriptional regulator [Eubacterium sp.]